MSGCDSSNTEKQKEGTLRSRFERLNNAHDARKPHVGAKPIPTGIKRTTSDLSQERRALDKEIILLQYNRMKIPSNTLQSIQEMPGNTKTGHDDESTDTSKIEGKDEKIRSLDESAREGRAYSRKQMTVAEIPNDVNEKKELGNVKESLVNQFKMMDILKELIETEKQYIAGLKLILDGYLPYVDTCSPQGLNKKIPAIFEYVRRICKNSETFLKCMNDDAKTADNIARIFINKASDLELYSFYPMHIPAAQSYLKQFDDVLQRRKKDLKDEAGLPFPLLSPLQRMGKYFLVLNEMKNHLEKSGNRSVKLENAISLVGKIKQNGSDYIVIDSIKNNELSFLQHGSFLTKCPFRVLEPKKFTSTVFLFQKVVVFTQGIAKSSESFTYVDSILTSDLRLEQFDKKPTDFKLTSYSKVKTGASGATYILQAESTDTKDEWIRIIKGILWDQFLKAKKGQVSRSRTCLR